MWVDAVGLRHPNPVSLRRSHRWHRAYIEDSQANGKEYVGIQDREDAMIKGMEMGIYIPTSQRR